MELDKKALLEYRKLAYYHAVYKTGDIEAAKDIASETIHLALLKKEEIENCKFWIIGTCNNYCKKYFESQKQKIDFSYQLRKSLLPYFCDDNNEKDYALHNAFNETLSEISDDELKLILLYFHCKKNAKTLSEVIDNSYESTRKRIFRIKSKIKADTYKKLGVIAGKKIVSSELNDAIIRFLKSFKKNLENGTLHKMKYYFSEIDLKNYNPTFEIEKIIDYKLNLKNNVYTVYVIYYTKDKTPDSFHIKFNLDKKNHLHIITPPTKTKILVSFDTNSEEGKKVKHLLQQYPENRTGISPFPNEEITKIINQASQKNSSASSKEEKQKRETNT